MDQYIIKQEEFEHLTGYIAHILFDCEQEDKERGLSADDTDRFINKKEDCMAFTKLLNEILDRLHIKTKCNGTIYTYNTDREFFGAYIMPNYDEAIVNKVIITDDRIEEDDIKIFSIEIDSRAKYIPYINPRIYTFILLEEIIRSYKYRWLELALRTAFDNIFAITGKKLDPISGNGNYLFKLDLLRYVFTKANRYVNNFFEAGWDMDINNIESIDNRALIIGDTVWTLNLMQEVSKVYSVIKRRDEDRYYYDDMKLEGGLIYTLALWAVDIIHQASKNRALFKNAIEDLVSTSGSELEQKLFNNILKSYHTVEYEYVSEGNKPGIFKNLKLKGLKKIEQDLYEYNIRMKNIDNELDAIDILRGINYRINLIDDYIEYNDLSDNEISRWGELKLQYIELRAKLMSSSDYKRKEFGLFIDYSKVGTGTM